MLELAKHIPDDGSPAAAWLRRVSELPVADWGVIVVMIVAGLILWLAGARFLKGSLVIFGGAAGCVAGSLLPRELGWSSDPILPATLGLIVGAVVGWMSFRYAAGVLLAIVVALAAPLAVLVTNPWTHALGAPTAEHQGHFAADLTWEKAFSLAQADDEASSDEAGEKKPNLLRPVLSRLNNSLDPLRNSIPDEGMRPLALAAAAGAIVGFGMGLVMPRRGAAFASATIGSALWLPAIGAAALAENVRVPDAVFDNPAMWVGIWTGAALLGASIQWTQVKKKADNGGQQQSS